MNGRKILIVDDEQDIEPLFRQRFRKELKGGDFNFHFCFSAEEALQYIGSLTPLDVVLVLSDINMPGMSGLELLKKVKNSFPHLKVMMVTAYGDEKNYTEAMSSGANDFITKPIDFTVLKDRILKLQ